MKFPYIDHAASRLPKTFVFEGAVWFIQALLTVLNMYDLNSRLPLTQCKDTKHIVTNPCDHIYLCKVRVMNIAY